MKFKSSGYFFLGLGVGVAAGLLYAPRTGREMQKYLNEKSRRLTDATIRLGNDLFDETINTIDDGLRVLQDQIERIADPVEKAKRAYARRLERIESVSPILPKRFRRAARMTV